MASHILHRGRVVIIGLHREKNHRSISAHLGQIFQTQRGKRFFLRRSATPATGWKAFWIWYPAQAVPPFCLKTICLPTKATTASFCLWCPLYTAPSIWPCARKIIPHKLISWCSAASRPWQSPYPRKTARFFCECPPMTSAMTEGEKLMHRIE